MTSHGVPQVATREPEVVKQIVVHLAEDAVVPLRPMPAMDRGKPRRGLPMI